MLKLALFFVVTISTVLAGPAEDIRNVLDAQSAAWNRGDIRAFMAGYEDAATTTFVGKAVTKGHAAVLARYLRDYPSKAKMGTLTFSDIEIHVLDPQYASVLGKFHLDRPKADGGEAQGWFTLLFKKTASGWKVILDHTS